MKPQYFEVLQTHSSDLSCGSIHSSDSYHGSVRSRILNVSLPVDRACTKVTNAENRIVDLKYIVVVTQVLQMNGPRVLVVSELAYHVHRGGRRLQGRRHTLVKVEDMQ